LEKNFKESNIEKFKRLSNEYDLLREHERAEWYIQNLLTEGEKKPHEHNDP